LIEKKTLAGHQLKIINENLEVCKTGRVGIWIERRFYEANKEGIIMIPYTASTKNV